MVFPDRSALIEASGRLVRENSDMHESLIAAGYDAPIDTKANYQYFLERSEDLTTVTTLVLGTLKILGTDPHDLIEIELAPREAYQDES